MRIVGIAGSLRSGSYNAALLRAAAEEAPPEATIEPIRKLKRLAAARGYSLIPGHDPVVWASGLTAVAIAPDLGERYLDTVYQTNWIEAIYGRDVPFRKVLTGGATPPSAAAPFMAAVAMAGHKAAAHEAKEEMRDEKK